MGDPALAAKALELIDVLIVRNRETTDLILRAAAAGRAGMDDYAWASLERLLSKLPHSRRARMLARRALETSRRLGNTEGSQETLRKLKSAAGESRSGA